MNTRLSFALVAFAILTSCKNSISSPDVSSLSDDSSSGSIVAGAVGGAIESSDTNGNLAQYNMNAHNSAIWSVLVKSAMAATNSCPKIVSSTSAGCSQNGNAVDLTYSSCSFGNSKAVHNGILEVSLSDGSAINCGTFPNTMLIPNNQSIQRQYVASAGVPGTATRINTNGKVVSIDDVSTNLSNFDNQAISANIGAGFGTQMFFDGSGARKQLIIKRRLYSSVFDHSINGNLNLAEASGVRTVNGSITVFHNKMKVVGTSSLSNVTYNNSSCIPVSGSITTTFAAGVNVSPNPGGALLVGKSESLVFNGDGTARFTDVTGTTTTVTVNHCY